MDLQTIGRIVSFVIGAGAIFILQFELAYPAYVAIPAGIVGYTACRLVFALIGAKSVDSK
jgi:hypothetical protein